MTDNACGRIVLVVEDDPDVREALEEVLRDHAYVPVACGNGEQALDWLRTRDAAHTPCLILLDMMMPIMDGWQFRAAQMSDASLGDIPVVVLTAHTSAEAVASDVAAVDFLEKPLELTSLLQKVERYCAQPG